MAVLVILVWLVTSPLAGYSDTRQRLINTSATSFTRLMVLSVQNTRNRDTAAMYVKLKELVRATRDARNALFDLQEI